jgi:predicted metal-dependent hydrolase
MVVKAIINAIGKNKVKPKQFPIGTEKFTKQESKTLLEEAQGKIEKIQSGEAKAIETISRGDDYLSVKTSTVAPNLQPKKVSYKVNAPQSSSKRTVDNFLQEEEEIIKKANFDGNESDILNFNKINSSDDVLAGIRALGNQYSKSIKKQTSTFIRR